jgi:hypothetical protein
MISYIVEKIWGLMHIGQRFMSPRSCFEVDRCFEVRIWGSLKLEQATRADVIIRFGNLRNWIPSDTVRELEKSWEVSGLFEFLWYFLWWVTIVTRSHNCHQKLYIIVSVCYFGTAIAMTTESPSRLSASAICWQSLPLHLG